MKCLETEKLISYAYRLMDEPAASEVRAHLGECPRCREIVEQHGRLDALLDEWKTAEPTPGFDARVRQAVEAQQARREAWGFWGWDWARGLALASLGVLIIAGVVWFTQSHRWVSNSSRVATRQPQQASGRADSGTGGEASIPRRHGPRGRETGSGRPRNLNRQALPRTKTKTPKRWKTMIWPRISTYSRNFPRESHGLPTEPAAPPFCARRGNFHPGRDLAWTLLLSLLLLPAMILAPGQAGLRS